MKPLKQKVMIMKLNTVQKLFFILLASLVLFAGVSSLNSHAVWAQPGSFADLAESAQPAVVNISSRQTVRAEEGRRVVPNLPPNSPFQDFFDEFFGDNGQAPEERETTSLGSGFVIDEEGYVVTNNHVIGEAIEIVVIFNDGRRYEAELVGRDAATDLALLKIQTDDDEEFPTVEFGDSDDLRVGDWILAIGNPFGLGSSVTAGIVSARNRDIRAGPYDEFIQTDASINRGNSGGPMLNLEGEVVGVNTIIISPNGGNIGIGFAIPSNQVSGVVDQLMEFGRARRGWIGVSIQDVTEEIAESLGLDFEEGAIISSVLPDGPAEAAGVQVGDIIRRVDGHEIESGRHLSRVVADLGPDKTVDFQVWREGELVVLELTTGERANTAETQGIGQSDTPSPQAPQSGTLLGMTLAAVDDSVRARFDIADDISGVVVVRVSRDSEAARRGFRPGDVITQVNQINVSTVGEAEARVEDAREAGRPSVLLRMYRAGTYLLVTLPIEE